MPDFLHEWRVDRVEVIGQLLTKVVEEARERVYVAVELGLPLNTARNLCARHRSRAQLLFEGFGRLAVPRGAELARLPPELEKAALATAREGWEQACRRWGAELASQRRPPPGAQAANICRVGGPRALAGGWAHHRQGGRP